MKVCIGGTFTFFHKGHKKLIDTAFQTAGKKGVVVIGISEGKLLQKKKFVKPLAERIQQVNDYLLQQGYSNRARIKTISDKYDIAVDGDFDAIIVSPETMKTAQEINNKRLSKAKNVLQIIQIPFVLAGDNKPISSTRIFHNEIDEDGNVVS